MSWIQIYSGKPFWPLDPKVNDIDIIDIAHALSLQCRYAGHCKFHYSIAQHSVLVAENVSKPNKLWGLLHDASEAYLMDVPRPIKQVPEFQAYREAELKIMQCVIEKFGLSPVEPDEVKLIDTKICFNEQKWIMNESYTPWKLKGEAIPGLIIGRWPPEFAEYMFLQAFNEYAEQKIDMEHIYAGLR